jgi:hypothetical protein
VAKVEYFAIISLGGGGVDKVLLLSPKLEMRVRVVSVFPRPISY